MSETLGDVIARAILAHANYKGEDPQPLWKMVEDAVASWIRAVGTKSRPDAYQGPYMVKAVRGDCDEAYVAMGRRENALLIYSPAGHFVGGISKRQLETSSAFWDGAPFEAGDSHNFPIHGAFNVGPIPETVFGICDSQIQPIPQADGDIEGEPV